MFLRYEDMCSMWSSRTFWKKKANWFVEKEKGVIVSDFYTNHYVWFCKKDLPFLQWCHKTSLAGEFIR